MGVIKGAPPKPNACKWRVDYNNAEVAVVEAVTEREAIQKALEFAGISPPIHPVRAVKEQPE